MPDELRRPMRPPILIVLHGELSTPGRVAIQLRNRDISLDVRRPRFGDDLPKTLEGHSGVVIFGGPQSANDDDEIIKREIAWIGVPLNEKKPFLGICLVRKCWRNTLAPEFTSMPM